jgi:hypothetical protein
MESRLDFRIRPQPNGITCGPTCLHAIYEFYGDAPPLEQIVDEVPQLEDGGTLEVLLGVHALRRGYRARLYTYNLKLFDPTWFAGSDLALAEKLRLQMKVKTSRRLQMSSRAHLEFLKLGGEIRFEDLTHELLRRPLRKGTPIITGLSATYLYGCAREVGVIPEYDDVRGAATGHFVVLCGYDPAERSVLIADPLMPNPVSQEPVYAVGIDRLICAILLGILTYDGNLLVLTPPKPRRTHGHPPRRRQSR